MSENHAGYYSMMASVTQDERHHTCLPTVHGVFCGTKHTRGSWKISLKVELCPLLCTIGQIDYIGPLISSEGS